MKRAVSLYLALVASHTWAKQTGMGIIAFLLLGTAYGQDSTIVVATDTATLVQTDSLKDFMGAVCAPSLSFNHPAYQKFSDPNHYLLSPKQIKSRTRLMGTIHVGGYAAAMVGLYSAWYKKFPMGGFRSFDDSREWKGIDKLGHAYSAYAESKASMELWRWAGVGRKKRILYGGLAGAAYQTVIEVLDGFSQQWGWSWTDIGANLAGSGLIVGQELLWNEQRIQYKFSFHKKSYPTAALTARANEIYGKSTAERFIKDYNGQTYWLSLNLKSFAPKSKLPSWLNIAVGTGAEGLYGANANFDTDEQGNVTFDRRDIKRYRQWYLSPDIDLSKIKTNKKGLKILFGILNIVKIPMPTLELSNGKLRGHWFYF